MAARKWVAVRDLYVQCSHYELPLRGPLCGSDTCRGPATSVVVLPHNGNQMYRCRHHAGMIPGQDHPGKILYQIKEPKK